MKKVFDIMSYRYYTVTSYCHFLRVEYKKMKDLYFYIANCAENIDEKKETKVRICFRELIASRNNYIVQKKMTSQI